MPSEAFSGLGTKFRRLGVGGWEEIAEIKKISGPSMKREIIDVTSLDSEGGYREFIASLRDGGDLSLDMIFRRDNWELLLADFEDNSPRMYEILLPDENNTGFIFRGYVMDLPPDITFDDAVTMAVTIKITGEVSSDSGSGSDSGHP